MITLTDEKNPFGLKEGEKKKVLFTTDGCGYCEDIKQRKDIQEKMATGEIVEKKTSGNENNKEAYSNLMEAAANDIVAYPTVAEAEYKDGVTKLCELDSETGKLEKCRIYVGLSSEEKEVIQEPKKTEEKDTDEKIEESG